MTRPGAGFVVSGPCRFPVGRAGGGRSGAGACQLAAEACRHRSDGEREVYRVVTFVTDHRGNRIVDKGPWLASRGEAEYWAKILRKLGYQSRVEQMHGGFV